MSYRSTATGPARVFPTREQLQAAVASIPTTTDQAWRQRQGPRYRLEFSPGSVRVTATDYWLRSKSEGLAADRKARENVAVVMEQAVKPKRGQIREWSEKSRARMPLRFATLDYSKMFEQGELAALVTLTYPMEWQRLAPDAKTFKRHVNRLRQKFLNSWGGRTRAWAGIWKMEFQRRGAPHLHIGTTVPAGVQRAPLSVDDRAHLAECSACSHPAHLGLFEFREWLARTWAAIVFKDHDHPPAPWSFEGWRAERAKHERAGVGVDTDEGQRYSDPKRLAVYFAKHGMFAAKEYQNEIPELWRRADVGGATFWGCWVVRPLIVSKETHEALIMHIMSVASLRIASDESPRSPGRHGAARRLARALTCADASPYTMSSSGKAPGAVRGRV